MRKTRPDGNCFFRAFGFSLFNSLLAGGSQEVERIKYVGNKVRDDLGSLGYSFTIDDFHEQFISVLEEIKTGDIKTPEDLKTLVFNDPNRSDYLVVFLRLMTSCYLQQNSDSFAAFIEDGLSVPEFCKTEVEPMFKESDHIHIVAIADTMGVGVRINYLDRGGSVSKVNVHDFPDGVDNPCIHLLYRPGHYDVLYIRNQEEDDAQDSGVGSTTPSATCPESSEQIDAATSSSLVYHENGNRNHYYNSASSSTDSPNSCCVKYSEEDGVSCSKALKLDPSLAPSSSSTEPSSTPSSTNGSNNVLSTGSGGASPSTTS